ncbi:MAG: hypothetical protein KDI92_11190, partial [Xanthomonadales bacterium]|nr:hypothetical protein [Xanthomonadales bacterium]
MKKTALWVVFCLLMACGDNDQRSQDSVTSKSQTDAVVANDSDIDATSSEVTINELTAFKVLSVSEGIYDNTNALQINFNLPLKQSQDFESLIKVKAAGQVIKTDWLFSDNKMVLYYPFIEAVTNYEINISQSLSSVNNKLLSQASKVSLTTQPKQQMARFVSKGNTLLSTDKDLPIEAVNVDAVELKFWKVKDEVLYQFLQQPDKRDIYSLKKLTEMADLVYTSHYELNEVKNKTEQHNIPIGQIKAIKAAGTYFVTMMPDDASYDYEFESTWFIQTDLGIHTRVYKNTVAVFTHQIPAAKSYPEVQVQLIDHKGDVVDSGVTDSQGFVSLDFSKTNQLNYVMAQRGDAINLVRLQQPKLDLSEFGLAKRSYRNQELFLYAPRDLYRPGETVRINGLLRDADGQMVTASPIKVEIRRPDNRLFKSINWLGDDLAFYQTSFAIPKDAMTGTWSFNARLANNSTFNYRLQIEDFLPERLKLDLSAGNDSVHVPIEQAPLINIQSDYLYGAPAAGNRYDATVSVSATTELFDAYEAYHFGSNHYNSYDSNFTTDASELDQNGAAVLTLPIKWQNTQFPLRINAHVNVYEAGGRPIARSIQQTVWPQPMAVGVKPMWDGRFASPNRANTVSLLAVNRAGEAVDLERAEIMLVQENRERYWHWGDDGWGYRNNSQEITVYNAVVNIAADASTQVSLPLDYGMYRVEIRTQDQQLISSYRFFSGWRWYDPYAYQGEKPDQVKLAWQADAVTPGQTAGLL